MLLTGSRQTGKSSLLRKLFPSAEYVTLDRPLDAEEAETNPTDFLRRFQGTVIIDEVQYAPALFRHLKLEIDAKREAKGSWLLTGNQQFGLMRGVSESLAGRIAVLELDSLSAVELRDAGLMDEAFLFKGGYPELWSAALDHKDFYRDYIATYLERDLRAMLEVADLRTFNRFLRACALRVGNLVNYADLARDVGTTSTTAKRWLDVLSATGIIHCLEPYSGNLGKRFIKAPKLFFRDHGLLCSLLNVHDHTSWSASPHRGALWESVVFSELWRALALTGDTHRLFFWRDSNNVEVDFVVEDSGRLIFVEAKAAEAIHAPTAVNPSAVKAAKKAGFDVSLWVASRARTNEPRRIGDITVYNPLLHSIPGEQRYAI